MSTEEVYKTINENDIEWIQIHIIDLFGMPRVMHFPATHFIDGDILRKGFNFDGSSVGFKSVDKSDMRAIPDPDTFVILPHQPDEALMYADLFEADGSPYKDDPRQMLRSAFKRAQGMGFDGVDISPEMEFYVFGAGEDDISYDARSNKGYMVATPQDDAKEYRKILSAMVMDAGFPLKYHHHECGASQHEVEIGMVNAIRSADFCTLFKFLSRDLAAMMGLQVTFMPKPVKEEAGSGMHAHIMLKRAGENAFFSEGDEYNLSEDARYFIGGMLDHARALSALGNPIVNSFKRLVPHFEAPIYIAWAGHNRSTLVRIPARKEVDVEIRSGDPAANPYMYFAAILHAGLDGIERKISYDPVEHNIYEMSKGELNEFGIKHLPRDLSDALDALEADDVLMDALGRDVCDRFIESKRSEIIEYSSCVSEVDWEFYLNC